MSPEFLPFSLRGLRLSRRVRCASGCVASAKATAKHKIDRICEMLAKHTDSMRKSDIYALCAPHSWGSFNSIRQWRSPSESEEYQKAEEVRCVNNPES
jgi:hypothetical protein